MHCFSIVTALPMLTMKSSFSRADTVIPGTGPKQSCQTCCSLLIARVFPVRGSGQTVLPPADKLDHPVVGICWYEANAYATWVGKRLPSSEEWQRAGTWPMGHAGDVTNQRYPWGDAFDPRKANTWDSGIGDTVAVAALTAGCTPNGVRQLIGNVWEWVDAQFHPNAETGVSVTLDQTMAEIRGGAFDTYFHSQATCQFRTGQPLLFRGPNVGFRCCVSGNTLTSPEDSQTLATEQANS